ncbi:uncharacterized protein LOC134530631 [Bacillus rossius redtenbacheri]|uniref:uncharacterized protein LOC134530631 n=1 Tax=Bacillus rossius redtenbacheri TaxID=93214 RepID=UPI002FDC8D00
MFNDPPNNHDVQGKKSPLKVLVNLFKRKKHNVEDIIRVKSSTLDSMDKQTQHSDGKNYCSGMGSRVPSTLSVASVNIVVQPSCCPPASPSISTVTLTPGRTRDIDQDMQALRLSRQDNPFLQVLASRESLIDSLDELESDDAILMSQEFPSDLEVDPLTLPEIHEHMIRSPPPVTWPKSPSYKVFRFPGQPGDTDSSQDSLQHCDRHSPMKAMSPRHSRASLSDSVRELSAEVLSSTQAVMSPRLGSSPRSHQRSDRSSNPFLLLNPEVRRIHGRHSDDNVQLMSQGEEFESREGPSIDL